MAAEMSRESRAMLLNVLWHHQGGSSPVGQPLRKLLGIEQHAHLTDEQIGEAKWIDRLLARGATSRTYAALEANKGKPEPPDRRIPGDGDGAFAGNRLVYGPFDEATQRAYRVCADCPEPLGRGCDRKCRNSSSGSDGVAPASSASAGTRNEGGE